MVCVFGKKGNQDISTGRSPWLIVGLGNPGDKYAHNRHNVGYMVIDELLSELSPVPGTLSQHKKTQSLICQTTLGDVPVIFARSRAYMNLSGGSIGALAAFFKVPAEHIIVIHDELDLDPGTVRVKVGGGENGHNGLKSTSQALGTRDYIRVRVGIGRPPGRMDVAAFVLKDFTKAEREWLPVAIGDASDAVELMTTHGVQVAQNEIHGRQH